MNYKDKAKELMFNGVKIIDLDHTYIDQEVSIKKGTVIYPNTFIRGNSKIGENNIIDMGTVIINSKIQDNNHIINSYIEDSIIGNNNKIGPFAHIHSQTKIDNNNIIGNYVEIKKANLNDKIKVKHLSYLGDVEIYENVNIGGGVIIANYNYTTHEKTKSFIEDDVCVGANSVIISPLRLKKHSRIAAGSVITNEVPEYALAIARVRQINKENYNKKDDLV